MTPEEEEAIAWCTKLYVQRRIGNKECCRKMRIVVEMAKKYKELSYNKNEEKKV